MTQVGAVAGATVLHRTAEAADLIRAAYPAGSIVMDREYLDWVLAPREDLARDPVAALATDEDELVGFAAAAPVALALDHSHHPADIVSFVAVAPTHRGAGLARALYACLLEELRARRTTPLVLTFAQAGTAGAALIERCYPEAGWTGTELVPTAPRGILRRRLARVTAADASVQRAAHLTLADDAVTAARMRRDPRHVATAPSGARVLAVRTIGDDDRAVGVIDSWPATLTGATLAEALALADASLAPEVTQVMVSGLGDDGDALCATTGLRRLPGTSWRSWLWSLDPGHPALRAESTGIPIT